MHSRNSSTSTSAPPIAELAGVAAILVISVSRIGDTILATPALRALATTWPRATIEFLGHPKRAEVIRHVPFVHRVGTITKRSAPFRGRLSAPRFDLAFVYGYDAPLVEYALRVARRVVAFRQPEEALNRRLYRVAERPAFQTMHAVRMQLSLLAPLGISPAGLHLSYQVTGEERRWAAEELHRRLPSGARPLIGVQVASFPTKGYRDWPVENFIEVCHRIRSRHPHACFLVFGGSEEHDRTKRLHAELRECSIHYAGTLTLRQTAALMERLDLYLGVDTGPTHIMGALHRPMVALYHPYSPSSLLAPLEHPSLYAIDHPAAGTDCGPDTPMAGITVDQVWSRVEQALEHQFAQASA